MKLDLCVLSLNGNKTKRDHKFLRIKNPLCYRVRTSAFGLRFRHLEKEVLIYLYTSITKKLSIESLMCRYLITSTSDCHSNNLLNRKAFETFENILNRKAPLGVKGIIYNPVALTNSFNPLISFWVKEYRYYKS